MEVLTVPPFRLPSSSILSSKLAYSSTVSYISSPTTIRNPKSSNANKIFLNSYDEKNHFPSPSEATAGSPKRIAGDAVFSPFLSNPLKLDDGSGRNMVKMPTAPWMKDPFVLPVDRVLDLSKEGKYKDKDSEDDAVKLLTDGVRGGRGKHAMRKIIQKVTKLSEFDEEDEVPRQQSVNVVDPESSLGEFVEKLGNKICAAEKDENSRSNSRLPWARAERVVFRRRVKKDFGLTSDKLRIPEADLSRLRDNAAKMNRWVKANKAGVTQEVVDEIRRTWKKEELAMVKFDVPLCRNMERAREILEIKTGGTVIWTKKDRLVIYRGCNYNSSNMLTKVPSFSVHAEKNCETNANSEISIIERCSPTTRTIDSDAVDAISVSEIRQKDNSAAPTVANEPDFIQPITGTLYERETERLLDGLGPRFVDWWWAKPLPVDADLLPEVVPGFMTPLRRIPPHVRPILADDELTYLRKMARTLPTHFALGRNSKLQGLAEAILKLWEKSLIAKIAVKWGIPNTNNEKMAEELKHLTGGVLILRNKYFILLYRGKDFIPRIVANSLDEREPMLKRLYVEEENARIVASQVLNLLNASNDFLSTVGTFSEFQSIKGISGHKGHETWEYKVKHEAAKERLEKELRKQERKLKVLNYKWMQSEAKLTKLNSAWRLREQEADTEVITEEEKQCFRKVGLKMDEVLLLGRRGVYDGVIGSMHQHWKHREVAKVITMQHTFYEVEKTARMLERESGGILVGIEKLRKGHAIIIYRGKNHRRPLKPVPENLLTKKTAFERSFEIQRRGSLKFFARQREKVVDKLREELDRLHQMNHLNTPQRMQIVESGQED